MATKLDKPITRESTQTVNDRNILVRLEVDQTINFKLKGMKSGALSIPIQELYEQLSGTVIARPKAGKSVSYKKTESNSSEVSTILNRLRSLNMVTPCGLELKQRMNELLDEYEEELNKQLEFKTKNDG